MSLFSAKKLDSLIDRHKLKTGRRLTIREIAKETEISPAYLTLLKNGKRGNPSMDIVVKLSQFFQVAPEDLLEDTDRTVFDSTLQDGKMEQSQAEKTLQMCEGMISSNLPNQALDLLAILESSPEAKRPGFYTEIELTKVRALVAQKQYEEGLTLVEGCLNRQLTELQRAKALYLRARIHFYRERFTVALADFLNAKELAEASNGQDLLYQIHYALGITYKETYEYGSSIYHFECAQRMFPDSLPLVQKGHLLMGMGNTYLRLMSIGAAMGVFEQAETIYRQVGDQQLIAAIRHNIARVKMMEGKYEEAIQTLEESLQTHQEVGEHLGIAADLLELAHCFKKMELWQKVQEFAFRASVTYENGNKQGLAAQAKLLMIEALVKLNKVDTCKEMLDEIIIVFRNLEWFLFLAHACHIKAALLQAEGKIDESLILSLEALDLYGKYAQPSKMSE